MNWFQISLYAVGAIGIIAIISQVITFILPFFRDIQERIVNVIIQKAHKDIVRDHYFVGVRRRYLEMVYEGTLKKKKSSRLGIFEILKLLKTVKKTAVSNGVEPSELFIAIEEMNGEAILTIQQIAILLGQGVDRKQIVFKARRRYTFNEIVESQNMPIEWSDKLYNKSSAFYDRCKGRFNEF